MVTQPNSNHREQVIELGARTSLKFRESERLRLLTPGRGPCLIACLVLAVTLFFTDGGGAAFYEAAYSGAERTEAFLVGKPGAPLAFLQPGQVDPDRFRLHGIVYSSSRPIAVINEKACAPGEIISVRIGNASEFVQCLEIDPDAVRIQPLNGIPTRLELEPVAPMSAPGIQPQGR